MTIVDKVKNSVATIQQLSILAGIPADRIYKWKQDKSSPSADDIFKLEGVFRLISNKTKDEIKKITAENSTQKKLHNENDLQEGRQDYFYRVLKKLPLDEVVEKTGYSNEDVSNYLANKRTMPLEFMKAYCTAYGKDFDDINEIVLDTVRKQIKAGRIKSTGNIDAEINNYNNTDNQQHNINNSVNNPIKDDESLLGLDFTNNQTTMTERLMNQAFAAIAKKDEQIDRLIGIIETWGKVPKGMGSGMHVKPMAD